MKKLFCFLFLLISLTAYGQQRVKTATAADPSQNRLSLITVDGGTNLFVPQDLVVGNNLTVTNNYFGLGIDNLLNNQTLTGNGSIITRGLGDIRYAPFGSGGGSIFGTNLGSGIGVFRGTNANILDFYSFSATDPVVATLVGSNITFSLNGKVVQTNDLVYVNAITNATRSGDASLQVTRTGRTVNYSWGNSNGFITASATNGFVTASVTNGLASIPYANALTNGLVTASVTNGLASVVYANSLTNGFLTSSATNGFVTATVTNGLASIAYANALTNGFVTATVTNGLASIVYANSLTNGFVTATVTNGLASIAYVDGATNAFGNTLTNVVSSGTAHSLVNNVANRQATLRDLAAGANITFTTNGTTITIAGTGGGGGLTSVFQFPSQAILLDTNAVNLATQGYFAEATFQAAYDAADLLQQSLGGTSIVPILAGTITAAQAGDCTLTNTWNQYVQILGIGKDASRLGTIIADNGAGDGYSVNLTYDRVSLTGISSQATGGQGGQITVRALSDDNYAGELNDSSDTSPLGIAIYDYVHAGNITTSGPASGGFGGNINLLGPYCSASNLVSNAESGGGVFTTNFVRFGNVDLSATIGGSGAGGNIDVGSYSTIGNILTRGDGSGVSGPVTIGDFSKFGNIVTTNTASNAGSIVIGKSSVGLALNAFGDPGGNVTLKAGATVTTINAGADDASDGGIVTLEEGAVATTISTAADSGAGGNVTLKNGATCSSITATSSGNTGGTVTLTAAQITGAINTSGDAGGTIFVQDGSASGNLTANGSGSSAGGVIVLRGSTCGAISATGDNGGSVIIYDGCTTGNITATGDNVVQVRRSSVGSISAAAGGGGVGGVVEMEDSSGSTINVSGTSQAGSVTLIDGTTVSTIDASCSGGLGGTVTIGKDCAASTITTIGDTAGNVLLDVGAEASTINVTGDTQSGTIELKKGSFTTALTLGINSPTLKSNGAKINGQIDNIASTYILYDTILATNSANLPCVAEILSNDAQFINCLFLPNGTGAPIATSTPGTVTLRGCVLKREVGTDVTVNGNYELDINLMIP